MKHVNRKKKFNRHAESRKALMSHLASGLIMSGATITTLAKAKYMRPYVEKLITKARNSDLATRRYLLAIFATRKDVVEKLLSDVGPSYKERPGGYTRIQRTHSRRGDSTQMAKISLVTEDSKPEVLDEPKVTEDSAKNESVNKDSGEVSKKSSRVKKKVSTEEVITEEGNK